MPPDSNQLTNLSLHILMALSEGEQHGYAVGKTIETWTQGQLKPTTGSLYQAIKRLHDQGLIKKSDKLHAEPSGGPQRVFFKITEAGRSAVATEISRLRSIVNTAETIALVPTGPKR